MCSKHVEAWNKLIVKQKFCASSWLITEINILRCTVSNTSKFGKCGLLYTTSTSWLLQIKYYVVIIIKKSPLLYISSQLYWAGVKNLALYVISFPSSDISKLPPRSLMRLCALTRPLPRASQYIRYFQTKQRNPLIKRLHLRLCTLS